MRLHEIPQEPEEAEYRARMTAHGPEIIYRHEGEPWDTNHLIPGPVAREILRLAEENQKQYLALLNYEGIKRSLEETNRELADALEAARDRIKICVNKLEADERWKLREVLPQIESALQKVDRV